MIKVAPSILSADFAKLGDEIKSAEKAGADLIHVDVMDGHFVPNITIGPLVVKAIKSSTKLPIDVHLMIENPEKYFKAFATAGSDIISFHIETCKDPGDAIEKLLYLKIIPAIAINPDNDISKIVPYLPKLKMVLIMTVFPGFEGQKFIPSTLDKIKDLRTIISKNNLKVDIEVDGGINTETSKKVIEAGANILVAGSAVFYSKDYKTAISSIRG